MKLHLLRHAKTHRSSSTGRDFDRELLPRGIAQCADLSLTLPSELQHADVWCSSSKRTKETYERIQKDLHLKDPNYLEEFYLASRSDLFNALVAKEGNQDVLLIGHNYGISDLATYLLDDRIELQTAGYICISFNDFWWKELSRGLGTKVLEYRPSVR